MKHADEQCRRTPTMMHTWQVCRGEKASQGATAPSEASLLRLSPRIPKLCEVWVREFTAEHVPLAFPATRHRSIRKACSSSTPASWPAPRTPGSPPLRPALPREAGQTLPGGHGCLPPTSTPLQNQRLPVSAPAWPSPAAGGKGGASLLSCASL